MKLPVSSLCRGLLMAALALVTITAVSAAESFEGRVHMDMTSGKKKEKMSLEYIMKNGKMRMEPKMDEKHGGKGGMGIILDMPAREMIILMDMEGQKMFMRRPIPQATAGQTTTAKEGHKMSAPVATGRTEMIAGYKAAEYRTTGEKGEVIELWLAKGLGTFMSFSGGNPMGGRGAPPRAGRISPATAITSRCAWSRMTLAAPRRRAWK